MPRVCSDRIVSQSAYFVLEQSMKIETICAPRLPIVLLIDVGTFHQPPSNCAALSRTLTARQVDEGDFR